MCEYTDLIKSLDDNIQTQYGNTWNITLYSDGTGDLILPGCDALTDFKDLTHLKNLADSLLNFSKKYGGIIPENILTQVIMDIEE